MAKEEITGGVGVLWSVVKTALNNMFTELYQLFTGRAGGQTITGGTGVSESLTLSSTSNVTKGEIIAGSLSIDENAGTISVGPTTTDRATVNIDSAESETYAWEVRKSGVLYAHQVISDTVKGLGLLGGTYLAFENTEGSIAPVMKLQQSPVTGVAEITTTGEAARGADLYLVPDGDLNITPKNQADTVELNWTGTAFASALPFSVLNIKKADNAAISILTPNNKSGWLMFGDPDDTYMGGISYSHTTDALTLQSNNAAALVLDSSQKCILSKGLALSPLATETPTVNGQMTFESTNDTTVTIKLKGSDGVVRSVALTLA